MGITINQNKATQLFTLLKRLKGNGFTSADIAHGNVIKFKLRARLKAKGVDIDPMLNVSDRCSCPLRG